MNSYLDANSVKATTLPTGLCPESRRFSKGNQRFRGQTTVEFALICLPFFIILFAIVDYAQIYFYENSMQNGMREAARFATAGRVIQAYANGSPVYETLNGGTVVPKAISDGAREASRNECIRYWFRSNCTFFLPDSNITIVSAPTLPGVPPRLWTNSAGKIILLQTNGQPAIQGPGGENDYIQISVTNTITTITPLMGYLGSYDRGGWNHYVVRVSAIVKNEPAALNFEHTNIYSGEPYNPSWQP